MKLSTPDRLIDLLPVHPWTSSPIGGIELRHGEMAWRRIVPLFIVSRPRPVEEEEAEVAVAISSTTISDLGRAQASSLRSGGRCLDCTVVSSRSKMSNSRRLATAVIVSMADCRGSDDFLIIVTHK